MLNTLRAGGHDIAAGMQPIYSIMGLCPQHDLLWATLSGREHLRFYGTLTGMSGGTALHRKQISRHVYGCV